MKTNAILGGVLGVQVLLGVLTHRSGGVDLTPSHAFLGVERADITELRIASARDGQAQDPIRLVRKGGEWAIASSGDYPADTKKVDEVLDKLLGVQVREPIATTKTSHIGLSVGEKDFDKRVEVVTGDKQAIFYLGSGSAHAANIRKSDEEAVYAAPGVSAWSIGSAARNYYEPMYVEVDAETLDSLDLRFADHAITLRKDGETWTVGELPEGRTLDADAAKKLVQKAAEVRIADLPDPGISHVFDGGVRVDWTIEENGQNVTGGYEIGLSEGGRRPVKAHGNEHIVLATEGALKPVVEATLEGLLTKPAEEK